jgi:glycosyltransferase involved in cell wall biosynthesis
VSRPLRVAYVLVRPPGYSETFIGSEIRAVRAAGVTVRTFVARPGGERHSGERHTGRRGDAARVARVLARRPARLLRHVRTLGPAYLPRALLAGAYAVTLGAQVARFAPDVIHAHFVNLPTAVAVLVARDLGIPATATAHAADFLLERYPGPLDRRLRLLSHLFVVSDSAARQLADKGVAMSRIPHGVVRAALDVELVDGAVPERPVRRGDVTRLVTVARLVEKKGIDTGLDAVARLVAAGHPVRYDIYGDGPLRASLERRAEANGISGTVTFHGAVPHETVTAALAEADIAVLPCRRAAGGDLDGIPVFLMEAAGRGVPVVTTAVSGIPELTGHTGGWLVPPDDADELAEAITRVVQDPVEARRRCTALRHRVRTEFPPALQAERLLAVWRRLASALDPDVLDRAR